MCICLKKEFVISGYQHAEKITDVNTEPGLTSDKAQHDDARQQLTTLLKVPPQG